MQVQPANKSLGVVIRSAMWLGKGRPPVQPDTAPVVDEPLIKEEISQPPLDASLLQQLAKDTNALDAEPSKEIESVIETAKQETTLPATPVPDTVKAISAEVTDQEVVITFGDRRYRIRGLQKNLSYDQLKVNVLVSGEGLNHEPALHVDTLDLYSARPKSLFIKQAAQELGIKEAVIKTDMDKLFLKLEALQAEQIQLALAPKKKTITVSRVERNDALKLLQSPNLLKRIVKDFDRCGIVGEETNKVVAYLACVSRKLESPLAIMVQSSSAAGKSSLMDATLAFMPLGTCRR